jgi:hypothetical protein
MEDYFMAAVHFRALIEEDRIIRVPPGITLAPGEAEVILLQPDRVATPDAPPPPSRLAQRLAALADQLGISGLPTDLAENHDHYAHGASKGIDSL